jgi:hypothetical protein
MPIKWSALKVSEAMDEVEHQIDLADAFLSEAKAKAETARKITSLPQYVEQRLNRLIGDIERIDNVRSSIDAVREQERLKKGSQKPLI